MLFFQRLLYNFWLFLLQVVIFRQVMIENRYIQTLFFCKFIYCVVPLSRDVIVQSFFKVACSVKLLFACHKVISVIIDVLLYKAINQFCLVT